MQEGANTAERAPITTEASPSHILRHCCRLWDSVRPLCRTATFSPNRAEKRLCCWGVRDISGTRTIAPAPDLSTSSIARMYTSVLPLPVAPWSRNGTNLPQPETISPKAEACALFSFSTAVSSFRAL